MSSGLKAFFKPWLIFIGASLLVLTASRIGLVAWQYPRVANSHGLAFILLQGLRFDWLMVAGILFLPALLAPFMALSAATWRTWSRLQTIYLVAWLVVLVFNECATPSFINQYDLRPNILYVEYLKYPKEMLSTLWAAYKLPVLAGVLATALLAWLLWRALSRLAAAQPAPALRWPQAFALSLVLALVCAFSVRSTLDHRPVNPATVAFSTDPLVNTLPLSSTYNVLFAIYESRQETATSFGYGKMPDADVMAIVRREMLVPGTQFPNDAIPTLHQQQATTPRARPLNLVIVLEESLGAEFVGALGGHAGITPRLDGLSKEGWWFENLYATGTRSVRGIEAIISGFPPTPAPSVVKMPRSQTGFFTLAQLLAQHGYDTSFLYGGEAHFDNMGRFFANNGFKRIVGEQNYPHPVFTGSWGVSDEDLFNNADATFAAYPEDQPFFSLVFTSSNHSPFQYPAGRIAIEGNDPATVYNAVKYADYALGQFFDKARKSKYWQNTVFLVIADHNSRVYGPDLIPVTRFHIPALILGGPVQPAVFKPVASQIDMIPTLLSEIGLSASHPAIGRDLTRPDLQQGPGRAILQFSDTNGYLQGNQIVIFQNRKPAQQFEFDGQHLILQPTVDEGLRKIGLAHALWPSQAYLKRNYALPAAGSAAKP